ncbi:MAG: NAD-dependent epimerase/dehydratase family protein [Actinocatenispora sp.]
MRTLVLGGTAMLSKSVAEHARDAGHEVTCLARGKSGEPADGVRFVRADRSGSGAYDALAGERFDAVVDVSNSPREVREALAALADRAGHWTYVSTCNVYSDDATPGQRVDTAELRAPAPDDADESDEETYGARNVACEVAVAEAMGADRAFLCRPGLIVGPGDRVVRFAYWPLRLARGGEVLAPGGPDRLVQIVDSRDLADWIVRAGVEGLAGGYDATGAPMPMSEFLSRVAAGVGAEPELTWVSQDFLVEQGIQPWMGPRSLPLWVPEPEYSGFMSRDVSPSLAAGLRTRDLADTARDVLAWQRTKGAGHARDGGISAEEEAELLAAWHRRG